MLDPVRKRCRQFDRLLIADAAPAGIGRERISKEAVKRPAGFTPIG